MEMTQKKLLDICKRHQMYRTPSLNDTLYANFEGFTSIANLEEYTGLKAIFLEGNALTTLDGLPPLPDLRCLYASPRGQHCLFGIPHI
jgi:dynein assembly factor 1